LGENNFEGVQKPSQKDHLPTDGACIRMLIWKDQKKVQGLSLVCKLLGKVGRSHLIQGVMWWELKWC
jgi:hypothetical protein